MSINRRRMTATHGAHTSLVRIISFLLFLYWWKALKRRWWRTTPVATKTRYHGAGRALLRTRIYLLIFISLLRTFDPHMFKRVLVYFPLPFRLSGGFFPFRDPIRKAISFCGPLFFYEYFYVLGCGPQVGPFPSRPIMGSIRGVGTPPQTLAVI